jgi:hypothetical protein
MSKSIGCCGVSIAPDKSACSRWLARVGFVAIALAALVALATPARAQSPRICSSTVTTACWSKLASPYPLPASGTSVFPSTIALLTDGRVLVSAPEMGQVFTTLSPNSLGQYVGGAWSSTTYTATTGRLFAPSYVLRDGRFLICGGEYTNDGAVAGTNNTCDIFDPVTNTWAPKGTIPNNTDQLADTVTALLADGTYLTLDKNVNDTWLLSTFGVTPTWSRGATPPKSQLGTGSPNEGISTLLPDGSVLFGSSGFARYLPTQNSWVNTATMPSPGGPGYLINSGSNYEIGASLLLPSGKVLILGGNTKNAIYIPPSTLTGAGSWVIAADTPTPSGLTGSFNHGDCPAAVEPDGRVLTIVSNDSQGLCGAAASASNYAFEEYNPANDTWSTIVSPDTTFNSGNRMRMLDLPDGTIMVTGFGSGNIWFWTPAGAPASAWQPTVSSLWHASSKEFVLLGTQLNGLTTGAEIGDDAKANTNYPIVSLTDGSALVSYAHTYSVDQLAPRPGVAGYVAFDMPAGLRSATYTVRAIANGVKSSNSLTLAYSTDPRVVAARQSSARTSIFYVSNLGTLTTRWVSSSGVWSSPIAIAGPGFAPPGAPLATIKQNANQLDVFVVANDGKIYYAYETNDGAWTVAAPLTAAKFAIPGAHLATGLQAGTQNDLFVIDLAGTLQGFAQSASSSWSANIPIWDMFGPSGASLAVGNQGTNQLDVFSIGFDGNIIATSVEGFAAFDPPIEIGNTGMAVPGTGIATGRQGSNQLDIMFPGVDGAIYVAWVVGQGVVNGPVAVTGTGQAYPLGDITTSPQATNQLDVFYVNNAGALFYVDVVGTGAWSSPIRLSADGAAIAGDSVSVATQGTNQYDVFLSAQSGLREATTTGTAWSSLAAF